MPKNDEGEFELILGNRQLISVFLIVVVLLGVFFSMGYIVGRNSAGASELARAEKPSPAAASDSSANADTSSSAASAQPPAADTDAAPPQTTPPAITQPEKPAEPAPAPAEKHAKPKPAPAPESAPASVAGDVPSGAYWQVVATARPDAEIIAEALGKKGYHAILSPAPKDGVFRVLVGPLRDAPAQAQTRTGLEAAGFKNPILRKY